MNLTDYTAADDGAEQMGTTIANTGKTSPEDGTEEMIDLRDDTRLEMMTDRNLAKTKADDETESMAKDNTTEVAEMTTADTKKDSHENLAPGGTTVKEKKTRNPVDMILDGVAERFSQLQLDRNNLKVDCSICSLWLDAPPVSKVAAFDAYAKFFNEEFLTDLTFLVGPDQVSIKVHTVVLAAHFEYFRSMLSTGLKESASSAIHLPFVGPEDLRLILLYAYSGEANLTKVNVFKMAVMANYFGSDDLINRCCNFIKKCITLNNCVKLFDMVSDLDINQLTKISLLFVVDHLDEVSKDDLSALQFELLLQIIQHPAAQMCEDSVSSEKHMFHLLWNKMKFFTQEKKNEFIPKVLKAIHLPRMDRGFLFKLLREIGHIREARELIANAGEDIEVLETREWYLPRFTDACRVMLFDCGEPTGVNGLKCDKPIEVNGVTTYAYSPCVLIKGFPFFMYATPRNGDDNGDDEYHVESPITIENLGLRYKVVLEMLNGKLEWIPVNTYHYGGVDKRPVDDSYKDEDDMFHMRVELQ